MHLAMNEPELILNSFLKFWKIEKQFFRGVLKKTYSENMHQIYRRTPMPKCDFNKVALHFGIGVLL